MRGNPKLCRSPKFFPYLDSATADKMELEVRAIRARRQIEEKARWTKECVLQLIRNMAYVAAEEIKRRA